MALLFALLCAAPLAHAAATADACSHWVDALPATLDAPGTWCLASDLATTTTTAAITVTADDATLDCLGHRLDGREPGLATTAIGVLATDRRNLAVRHCWILGFNEGVKATGTLGSGHLVEDNRFDGNTVRGIHVVADGSIVRRNRVFDTGQSTVATVAVGIHGGGSVDIADNTIDGVTGRQDQHSTAYGIGLDLDQGRSTISGNRVRGVVQGGDAIPYGIAVFGSAPVAIRGNDLTHHGAWGAGIACASAAARVRGNTVSGFPNPISGCGAGGIANVIRP